MEMRHSINEYIEMMHEKPLNESVINEDDTNDLVKEVQDYYDTNLAQKFGDAKWDTYKTYYACTSDYENISNVENGEALFRKKWNGLARALKKAGYRVSLSISYIGRGIDRAFIEVRGKDERSSNAKDLLENPPAKKRLKVVVGDIYMSFPPGSTKEDLIDYMGEEAYKWLLTHTPLKSMYGMDDIYIFFKANPQFAKLKNMDYNGARRMSSNDVLFDR